MEGLADSAFAVSPWCVGVGRAVADEMDAVADACVEQDAGSDASGIHLVG